MPQSCSSSGVPLMPAMAVRSLPGTVCAAMVGAFANTDRYTVENCPSIGVQSYADFQSSYAPHGQNWFVLSADLSKTFDASCRAP